jgi:aspartyl-tRNA(Asn)/glutamyl-tRNA(Gln) amidotransferase subunit A
VVALPTGLGSRSGLPVGVSLIGLPDSEPLLVQAAIDLQEHELPPLRLDAER